MYFRATLYCKHTAWTFTCYVTGICSAHFFLPSSNYAERKPVCVKQTEVHAPSHSVISTFYCTEREAMLMTSAITHSATSRKSTFLEPDFEKVVHSTRTEQYWLSQCAILYAHASWACGFVTATRPGPKYKPHAFSKPPLPRNENRECQHYDAG
jgi:hypothetical protein